MKEDNILHPAVSIALCTYNGERFLVEQIESLLHQEYENITEIICVDDNSTDGTWDILKEYASKYPLFNIFQNDCNLGFVKNFEKAITLTNNQLIAISDQDDVWYPTKISKLVDGIGDNMLIYSDNDYIDFSGKTLGIKFSDKRNLATCTSCLNFALFNAISGHTILLNRDLLTYALPFPLEIPYDLWLGFFAVQHGKIPVVHEALVGYRQHDTNTLGGYGVKEEDKNTAKFEPMNDTATRVGIFAKSIRSGFTNEKYVLELLGTSYADRSVSMRLKRMSIFWKNRDTLLLFKKRSRILKMIYCIKAFWKYD